MRGDFAPPPVLGDVDERPDECARGVASANAGEEIKAALLHATAYCGIPAGLDAFRAAHEVLVGEGALSKPGTPASDKNFAIIPMTTRR